MIKKSKGRQRVSYTERMLSGFFAAVLILLAYSTTPYLPEILYVDIPEGFQFKAAIIDQLSLTSPNQTFTRRAANILERAGFTVDYFRGEEVTVPFYKNLAANGYGLIILRAHTAVTRDGTAEALFTSESFDAGKYPYQTLTQQLERVAYTDGDYDKGITYFGINSYFITRSMRGKFSNALIILMGCSGAKGALAEAFIQKGAKIYIGWSDYVLATHTDLAITHLLEHFLIEKLKLTTAVRETTEKAGLDPAFRSLLQYYPFEVGNYTLQSLAAS